jgi:hypothetical protein
MTQYLTIFSRTIDHRGVFTLAQSFSDEQRDVVGGKERWDSIVVRAPEGGITINSMQRERPGDEFSRMILGAGNYFRDIRTTSVAAQQRLLELISELEWAIGVVAEPEYTETDTRLDLVFEIARHLNAVIFNGSGMIDKDGLMILEADGSSEVSETKKPGTKR